MLPSLKVPMAESCSLSPAAMDELGGLTASDTSTAGVTVNIVAPLTDPEVAVMFVLPLVALVAAPAALMLATTEFDDVQPTVLVMSRLLPSLYLPVAVNCCARPSAIDGFEGETCTAVNVTCV